MGEFLDFIYQDFKYKLYVPDEYKAERESPLIVMLHGCEQDPDDFAAGTRMNLLAEKENFLVLYPNMNHLFNPTDPASYNPLGCWNWFLDKNQHRGKGHPKLIYEIIAEVKSKYMIDSNRVYATGLSAGASLACILGVTYPDVFSAIGICSGLPYDAANVFFLTDPMAEDAKKSMEKGVPDPYVCGNTAFHEMGKFKRKMRVIVFHGILDTTVHPINGQQVITQWAQTNFLVEGRKGRADVTPAHIKADIINDKSYTQHVYNDANGEPIMELWMIDQMGHTWSGGSPEGSYTDPFGPNATEIIWKFFSGHPQDDEKKMGEADISMEEPSENESNIMESSEKAPVEAIQETPDFSAIQKEVETPVEASLEVKAEPPDKTTVEPSTDIPVKQSIDVPHEPQKNIAEKPTKRNLFNAMLSKFKKKKR